MGSLQWAVTVFAPCHLWLMIVHSGPSVLSYMDQFLLVSWRPIIVGCKASYASKVAPSSAYVVVCNMLILWDMNRRSVGAKSGSGKVA